MTNAQIIFNAEQQLAKEGKIGYTGRVFEGKDEAGNVIQIKETESIHTYQGWLERGFQVQKGQKAVAKFTIWKHTGAKAEKMEMQDGNAVEYIDKGHMFMKTAAFFAANQVTPVESKEA